MKPFGKLETLEIYSSHMRGIDAISYMYFASSPTSSGGWTSGRFWLLEAAQATDGCKRGGRGDREV